jgi:O-antigen/teichoic acid export membrane protein
MKFKTLRDSKNFQNSFWNIIEVLLTPFIFFVSIPIFLAQLGEIEYGIWMFVNAVIIFLQVMNLGLNFSTYKHVSVSLSTQDNQQITRTLNTNLSLNFIIFLASLIICSVLSWGIYQFSWFDDQVITPSTLIICLFLGMGILFTKLTEQILYNVYRAFEDFKYVTFLTVLIKVVLVSGNIFIAYLTHNIIHVFCFTLLISLVGIIANYLLMKRFLTFFRFKFALKKEWIRFEVKYSSIIWIQSIAVIVAYQGDRLLVSYSYGLYVLSFYTIVATLFNHIHMAFSAMLAWLFPQIAKNKVNIDAILKMYLSARNISIAISVFLLATFVLLSEPLFTLWLGEENYLKIREFVKWFSVFEFFFIFNIIPHFFLNASDNERFSLKLVGVFTGINVIGIILGFYFGQSAADVVAGLAISTVFGMYYLHHAISLKFFEKKKINFEILMLFIPSIFGSSIVFFDNYWLKITLFLLCSLSIYLIFVKRLRTNFKLMVE